MGFSPTWIKCNWTDTIFNVDIQWFFISRTIVYIQQPRRQDHDIDAAIHYTSGRTDTQPHQFWITSHFYPSVVQNHASIKSHGVTQVSAAEIWQHGQRVLRQNMSLKCKRSDWCRLADHENSIANGEIDTDKEVAPLYGHHQRRDEESHIWPSSLQKESKHCGGCAR